jgi:B-box zinc finger
VSLQIAACPNHPQREAIGICVRCRTRVCSECATKVDGINYCVACLGSLVALQARRGSVRPAWLTARISAYVSAGAYFMALSTLVWALLEVTFPGAPR